MKSESLGILSYNPSFGRTNPISASLLGVFAPWSLWFFSDRTSANQSRKRGPSRDQSFLTYSCLSIRCFGTGRARAGDRRYIEDHVRAVHCYAESGLDRDLAERILPRRQTCLDARREPVRRECAKFQSRMPIAGQFQKADHAAYRKHAGEIGGVHRQQKSPGEIRGFVFADGVIAHCTSTISTQFAPLPTG